MRVSAYGTSITLAVTPGGLTRKQKNRLERAARRFEMRRGGWDECIPLDGTRHAWLTASGWGSARNGMRKVRSIGTIPRTRTA